MLISRKRYNAMLDLIAAQQKTIKIYQKQIEEKEKAIRILTINVNSQSDIIFPNTDERGLNAVSGTATIPEIFEM